MVIQFKFFIFISISRNFSGGLRPPSPRQGAPPLDPAGGCAPRPLPQLARSARCAAALDASARFARQRPPPQEKTWLRAWCWQSSTSELYTQSGLIQWDTDVVIQFKFFIFIFNFIICISSLFDLIIWMFFICIETK